MPIDPVELCTAQDVILRFGGEEYLTQALDPHGTGTYDSATLTLAIRDASAMTVMHAGVQAELAGLTNAERRERFPALVTLSALQAVAFAWDYGTRGQARPQHVQTRAEEWQRLCDGLKGRMLASGHPDSPPQASQRVASVNMDPRSDRLSLASWKRGFC